MLARRSTSEVVVRHDDARVTVSRPVENEVGLFSAIRAKAQRPEQKLAEIVGAGFLQEASRQNLVGIAVDRNDRRRHCVEVSQAFHAHAPSRRRTSVRRPVTAAAAAMAGLIRWVRTPGPWRPMKLRF